MTHHEQKLVSRRPNELEGIPTVRAVVLLTKMLATAYVVVGIGNGIINAILTIGGY